MVSKNQNGSVLSLVLIIVLAIGFIGTGIFGFMSYQKGQDYKNNYEVKAKADVATALEVQKQQLQDQFAQQSKSPVKTYKGPVTYGVITFDYPRTWSAYVDETNTSTPIEGYFQPGQVASINSKTSFALRVELLAQDYPSVIQQYSSQLKDGELTAAAYIPEKLKGKANVQPGVRYDGLIDQDITGAVVVMQVRDKTLKISTESKDFLDDFNNIVLPSLTFSP